jgi:predicted AAA+ superfamily ATPase
LAPQNAVNMSETYPRIARLPKQSFFLLGPRGTGKSTWVREVLPNAPRVDLLDEGRYQTFLAQPAALADELRALPRGSWVVLDEVQRLPSLLNEVQRFIVEHQLKGADFALETVLAFGTLPVVWQAPSRKDALLAYARMYLREEIQAEATVRNLPGFARFLPIAALFHGQVLNAGGVARDAGVSRSTVLGYLDVLEDTLIAFRLPTRKPDAHPVCLSQLPGSCVAESRRAIVPRRQPVASSHPPRGAMPLSPTTSIRPPSWPRFEGAPWTRSPRSSSIAGSGDPLE